MVSVNGSHPGAANPAQTSFFLSEGSLQLHKVQTLHSELERVFQGNTTADLLSESAAAEQKFSCGCAADMDGIHKLQWKPREPSVRKTRRKMEHDAISFCACDPHTGKKSHPHAFSCPTDTNSSLWAARRTDLPCRGHADIGPKGAFRQMIAQKMAFERSFCINC
ncbi:hypothetical protein GDO78_018636 [Eleutherodactylus coqui]|uniref:Uncharacterized protein n=1 Tax=Eleutherodactylus coqui TaxID=57060 RepID=A0A8J6EJ80_ELECQ|nr:hypothetical protein GDO78_018636 [Eleutherodactylus coqui]